MLLKDKLESDTRDLFKVQEVIELAGKTHSWLIENAKEKNTNFLYKVKNNEVVYCLIPKRKFPPLSNHAENDYFSLSHETTYLPLHHCEYAVVSYQLYNDVLLEGESALKPFTETAIMDIEKKALKYTHASSIKDTYLVKPRGHSESFLSAQARYIKNEFLIFINPQPSNIQKLYGYFFNANCPKAKTDTTVTIRDLWITRESLLLLAGETLLDEDNKIIQKWMNEKLIALNIACYHFSKNKNISKIEQLLKDKIEGISDTALNYCVEIATRKHPGNIAIPNNQAKERYAKHLPYCLINMNEISRQLYEEYSEILSKGNSVKSLPVGEVKDKAEEQKALPKRMLGSLSSFMMPNF